MFVLSDKISARYNLFGSGLPTRLRTTVLPWHNPEPVHSVFIHAYTGHLVPEPNRILFHTVTFFNFVLYGLPGFLFLQIWYNVEHKIFMIQK